MKQNTKTKYSVSLISGLAFLFLGAMPVLAAAPTAPTNLSATPASQTQINLSWTDNSGNETGFKIERSTNGTSFSQIGTVTANVTTYSSTGLTADTTYYYRVRAYTNQNSAYTNTASATTLTNIPVAPSSLSASPISQSQINISWTDNSNNENGFLIERGTDGINFTQISGTAANTTSFSDTSRSADTTYYYRVRAYNSYAYSNYSNVASATTLKNVPSAPTSLTASAISQTQINLAWTDNATNEDGYKIEMGTSTSSFIQINTVGANSASYSATGLSAGVTYYFRIRAFNNGGNSSYSNNANATTIPNAPTAPSNLSGGYFASSTLIVVYLNCTDNSNNESGFKWEKSSDGVNFSQIGTSAYCGFTDAGFYSNVSNYYRVRAYNLGGDSDYSNTFQVDIP